MLAPPHFKLMAPCAAPALTACSLASYLFRSHLLLELLLPCALRAAARVRSLSRLLSCCAAAASAAAAARVIESLSQKSIELISCPSRSLS